MFQRIRINLQVVAPCMVVALLIVINGCAATSFDATSRTGGVELTLSMVNPEGGSASLYKFSSDGTLGFGGGMDAHSGRTSWTGSMTDEQIEEFLTLLDRLGWFDHIPESTGIPQNLVYRIEIKGSQGRQRYTVNGRSESVQEVMDYLDGIANVRFEPILRRMPQPGVQD